MRKQCSRSASHEFWPTCWKFFHLNPARVTTIFLLLLNCAHADNAAFDLPGPRIQVKVTRSGKTLPISEVPTFKRETGSGFIRKAQSVNRCTTC